MLMQLGPELGDQGLVLLDPVILVVDLGAELADDLLLQRYLGL